MNPIEKCCRAICKQKGIVADALVCPLEPKYMNSLPLVNGFYIPDESYLMPAWRCFEQFVKIILTTLEYDDEMDEFDDSDVFREFLHLINPPAPEEEPKQ